jgi:hypothetical protein
MRTGVWEWYLRQDGKEYGPLSHRELLLIAGLGRVRSRDRLWARGFPSWIPAYLIPGLLKPSFITSMLTLSRSWEPALRRCRMSWLRRPSLLLGVVKRLAFKLPTVWLGVACVLVVIIVVTTTQNSEPSFAVSTPALFETATSACDPATQLQAFNATPILVAPAPMHEEIQPSENDGVVEATPIPPAPSAPMHEEQASDSDEVPEAMEFLPAVATEEDAIPPPTRKPVVELPLRSIDTKDGARSVQLRLRALGYLADDADGAWGPRSRIALRQFQARAKISRARGWDRRAERVLFSGNAPRALSTVPSPFAQALF